jgi:hypothetical protein
VFDQLSGTLVFNKEAACDGALRFNNKIRVTGLGEFSPIFGRLFSLDSFLKITEGARIFGPLFPLKMLYIHFDNTKPI